MFCKKEKAKEINPKETGEQETSADQKVIKWNVVVLLTGERELTMHQESEEKADEVMLLIKEQLFKHSSDNIVEFVACCDFIISVADISAVIKQKCIGKN